MLGRTQTKAEAWAQRRPDQVVPVFFVAKDLHGERVMLNLVLVRPREVVAR
jgi:hypothetical protein